MKRFFLGQSANYKPADLLRHTFAIGTPRDAKKLRRFLAHKYSAPENHVTLTKNGRSALSIALSFTLPPKSDVLVNGFTCYAVYEAIKSAGMTPVFVDIDPETLNFTPKTIKTALTKNTKAIIIQNTFGIPVDLKKIEQIAQEHDLKIIEDLAHCVNLKYADGREAGTVGIATILSFGKEKAIDTISGGALILRDPCLPAIQAPKKAPKIADAFRARFYPLFGAIYRSLKPASLQKIWLGSLLKLRLIERSADNKLDLRRRPTHATAKLALKQLKNPARFKYPLRQFALVKDRNLVLEKLRAQGFFFDGFWYEKPVSPARYYKKVHFPEKSCPIATKVANHIVNLPTYYPKKSLKPAEKIIKEHQL